MGPPRKGVNPQRSRGGENLPNHVDGPSFSAARVLRAHRGHEEIVEKLCADSHDLPSAPIATGRSALVLRTAEKQT